MVRTINRTGSRWQDNMLRIKITFVFLVYDDTGAGYTAILA